MSALHAAVLTAFKNMGWQYRVVEGLEVVESYFEAHHTKIFLYAQTHAETGVVSVVSQSSFNVPKTHLKTVAELLMRNNKELNLGNFEADWDTGQVMFRIASVFSSNQPDERIIASLIHAAVTEMDRLTPYLSELCKLSTGALLLQSVPELMAREDLLPAVPQTT